VKVIKGEYKGATGTVKAWHKILSKKGSYMVSITREGGAYSNEFWTDFDADELEAYEVENEEPEGSDD